MDILNAMENRVVHGEIVIVNIKECLKIFNKKIEKVDNLEGHKGDLSQVMMVQHQSLEEFQVAVMNSIEALRAQVEELNMSLEETKSDWALCKKAVASGVLTTNVAHSMRVKVSRLMRYRGKRRCLRD